MPEPEEKLHQATQIVTGDGYDQSVDGRNTLSPRSSKNQCATAGDIIAGKYQVISMLGQGGMSSV